MNFAVSCLHIISAHLARSDAIRVFECDLKVLVSLVTKGAVPLRTGTKELGTRKVVVPVMRLMCGLANAST